MFHVPKADLEGQLHGYYSVGTAIVADSLSGRIYASLRSKMIGKRRAGLADGLCPQNLAFSANSMRCAKMEYVRFGTVVVLLGRSWRRN
jgi:hypothetical protein